MRKEGFGQGRGGLLSLLVVSLLHLHLQVLALEHIKTPPPSPSPSPSHRLILQNSIVQHVNTGTGTGTAAWSWTATSNPYFANHTVAQFKHMLGAKRPPPTALHQFPLLTHQNNNISLPKHFDARAAWPQCTTISKILG